MRTRTTILFLVLFTWSMNAFAGFDIESGSDNYAGVFQRLVEFIQDCIDFIQGPFAVAFILLGIVVSLCMWIFAPDNRHLNKAFKAIAVGFVLFDVGLIMNYLIQ